MPFDNEQFLDLFATYNTTVWPAQVVLVLTALAIIWLARRSDGSRLAITLLAALWLWTGIVYHLGFFTRINPAAWGFGLLFIAQAVLLLVAARRGRLRLRAASDAVGRTGDLVALYALVLYPAIGALAGHAWPAAPTFGAPCPTTMFTFAVLLWAVPPVPRHLLAIPVLWSAIGTFAAVRFGIVEDFGMLVAAGLALLLILGRTHVVAPEGTGTVVAG